MYQQNNVRDQLLRLGMRHQRVADPGQRRRDLLGDLQPGHHDFVAQLPIIQFGCGLSVTCAPIALSERKINQSFVLR